MREVWVFSGEKSHYPSAIFAEKSEAERWISQMKLSGTLTKYPVGISVYEWAIGQGYFKPKTDNHLTAEFIGNFTTAGQEHYHYENS